MDELFKNKSLKLLVDPNKFKNTKYIHKQDMFKIQLEKKFNYQINNYTSKHLINTITTELIIDSLLKDIINQVNLNHNP